MPTVAPVGTIGNRATADHLPTVAPVGTTGNRATADGRTGRHHRQPSHLGAMPAVAPG